MADHPGPPEPPPSDGTENSEDAAGLGKTTDSGKTTEDSRARPESANPQQAFQSQSQSQSEDQIWQDLVSRLQSDSDAALFGHPGSSPAGSSYQNPAQLRHFSDFDPLGVQRPAGQDSGAEDQPPEAGSHSSGPSSSGSYSLGAQDFLGPRDYSLAEEADDEGFEPPEPEPLSAVQPALVLGWVGAAGAPLALLFCALFWRTVPGVIIATLILAFLAGVGYLVYRLPQGRQYSDGDGSAV